jgi:uncharacterized membrane protein
MKTVQEVVDKAKSLSGPTCSELIGFATWLTETVAIVDKDGNFSFLHWHTPDVRTWRGMFASGFLAGFAVAALVVAIAALFRHGIK